MPSSGYTSYIGTSTVVKPLFTRIVMQCLPRSRAESLLCISQMCISVSHKGLGGHSVDFPPAGSESPPICLLYTQSTVLSPGFHHRGLGCGSARSWFDYHPFSSILMSLDSSFINSITFP